MAKRIYKRGSAYLVTSVTQSRFPFFSEDIFCNILIDVIANCQKIKPFYLLGFKINPDHFHIILQPTGRFNFSQIVHNIKRVSSIHINMLIHSNQEEYPYGNFDWTLDLKFYRRCFTRKFNYGIAHPYPNFDWQDKFDDQIIRSPEQLKNSLFYLERQAVKHDLPANHFLFISKEIPSDLVFIGEKR